MIYIKKDVNPPKRRWSKYANSIGFRFYNWGNTLVQHFVIQKHPTLLCTRSVLRNIKTAVHTISNFKNQLMKIGQCNN